MPKKPTKQSMAKPRGLRLAVVSELQKRVHSLEVDVRTMNDRMDTLSHELVALKVVVKQVDERTIRGEHLMLEMQGEQRKISKTLDRIAAHLHVAGS